MFGRECVYVGEGTQSRMCGHISHVPENRRAYKKDQKAPPSIFAIRHNSL